MHYENICKEDLKIIETFIKDYYSDYRIWLKPMLERGYKENLKTKERIEDFKELYIYQSEELESLISKNFSGIDANHLYKLIKYDELTKEGKENKEIKFIVHKLKSYTRGLFSKKYTDSDEPPFSFKSDLDLKTFNTVSIKKKKTIKSLDTKIFFIIHNILKEDEKGIKTFNKLTDDNLKKYIEGYISEFATKKKQKRKEHVSDLIRKFSSPIITLKKSNQNKLDAVNVIKQTENLEIRIENLKKNGFKR